MKIWVCKTEILPPYNMCTYVYILPHTLHGRGEVRERVLERESEGLGLVHMCMLEKRTKT